MAQLFRRVSDKADKWKCSPSLSWSIVFLVTLFYTLLCAAQIAGATHDSSNPINKLRPPPIHQQRVKAFTDMVNELDGRNKTSDGSSTSTSSMPPQPATDISSQPGDTSPSPKTFGVKDYMPGIVGLVLSFLFFVCIVILLCYDKKKN